MVSKLLKLNFNFHILFLYKNTKITYLYVCNKTVLFIIFARVFFDQGHFNIIIIICIVERYEWMYQYVYQRDEVNITHVATMKLPTLALLYSLSCRCREHSLHRAFTSQEFFTPASHEPRLFSSATVRPFKEHETHTYMHILARTRRWQALWQRYIVSVPPPRRNRRWASRLLAEPRRAGL